MPHAPITLLLCAVTCVTTLLAFQQPKYLEHWLFRPHEVLIGRQYSRLATSALIHANYGHLLFNLFSLFCFGAGLEAGYGAWFMLTIYWSSVIGGSLLSLWLHRHEAYSALGASGGVCGVIFTFIFLFPGASVGLFPLPIPVPGPVYAIGFILVSVIGIRRGGDGIGHDAHLGGAMVGLAVATLFHPHIVARSPLLYTLVMASAGTLVYLLVKHPVLLDIVTVKSFRKQYRASERYQRYDEALERAEYKQELDQLLDKIARQGMRALTRREQERMRELSKRI